MSQGANYKNELARAFAEAREEWEKAMMLFNQVVEPDLVDEAIYRVQAAERRCMYLWKLARQKRVNLGEKLPFIQE